MLNNWNLFDKTIDQLGRNTRKLFRNGNGRIRIALACAVIVGMLLYPFWIM